MKAIEFKEVTNRIAEAQPEYETLLVHIEPDQDTNGYFNKVTMCFELSEEERKQVLKTGKIWHTVLVPLGHHFHPIRMSVLKPLMPLFDINRSDFYEYDKPELEERARTSSLRPIGKTSKRK
jgi:hypothetical protein